MLYRSYKSYHRSESCEDLRTRSSCPRKQTNNSTFFRTRVWPFAKLDRPIKPFIKMNAGLKTYSDSQACSERGFRMGLSEDLSNMTGPGLFFPFSHKNI